jgi:hypothetical protein
MHLYIFALDFGFTRAKIKMISQKKILISNDKDIMYPHISEGCSKIFYFLISLIERA